MNSVFDKYQGPRFVSFSIANPCQRCFTGKPYTTTRQLDNAARNSIGKTMFKAGGKEKFSNIVKDLQQKKSGAKTEIKKSLNHDERMILIKRYKEVQDEVITQI